MKKTNLMKVKDGRRTLYYHALDHVRSDGVWAVLVGYRKQVKDYWY